MDNEFQLKLQAYLDGELPEAEAREVANRLAQDQEAVALHGELRNTRKALAGIDVGVTLPESREFFWSKIAREIQRQERSESPRLGPSLFAAWRRFLFPAGAVAALVLAAFVGSLQLGRGSRDPELAVAQADTGAFTYRDYSAGATLVWLPYPAENEAANGTDAATFE